jgi:hypothetical protein
MFGFPLDVERTEDFVIEIPSDKRLSHWRTFESKSSPRKIVVYTILYWIKMMTHFSERTSFLMHQMLFSWYEALCFTNETHLQIEIQSERNI